MAGHPRSAGQSPSPMVTKRGAEHASGLHVAVDRSSYGVVGSSAHEIRRVMQLLGPARGGRVFSAYTDWEVGWSYSVEPGPSGLHVTSVRVAVRAAVLVPRWRPAREASAELVDTWQLYLAAIEVHEQGHVNLAVEAGRTVLACLEGLPAFAERGLLHNAAEIAARTRVAEARNLEHAYDEASSHGVAHGVKLPDDRGCAARAAGSTSGGPEENVEPEMIPIRAIDR